jgi:hypothetical protein
VGGPSSDEVTDTLVLYVYFNPSTGQVDDVNAGEAVLPFDFSANFFAKQTSEKPSRDGRVDEGQRTG